MYGTRRTRVEKSKRGSNWHRITINFLAVRARRRQFPFRARRCAPDSIKSNAWSSFALLTFVSHAQRRFVSSVVSLTSFLHSITMNPVRFNDFPIQIYRVGFPREWNRRLVSPQYRMNRYRSVFIRLERWMTNFTSILSHDTHLR